MKKKHLRIIREIQDRIPRDLLVNLTKKELVSPTVKKVFELALARPDAEVSPRQKRAIEAMLDSGRLDKEVEVIDTEIEKQIDAYITEEIDKAVRLGRLPEKADTLELLNNKGNQYARRQERRLRAEFGVEGDDVANAPEDDPHDKAEHPAREAHHPALPTPSAARR